MENLYLIRELPKDLEEEYYTVLIIMIGLVKTKGEKQKLDSLYSLVVLQLKWELKLVVLY